MNIEQKIKKHKKSQQRKPPKPRLEAQHYTTSVYVLFSEDAKGAETQWAMISYIVHNRKYLHSNANTQRQPAGLLLKGDVYRDAECDSLRLCSRPCCGAAGDLDRRQSTNNRSPALLTGWWWAA